MNPTPVAPPALAWHGEAPGLLRILDQTQLPARECYLDCTRLEQLIRALRSLAVRGAPSIGVATGYGAVLAAQELLEQPRERFFQGLTAALDRLEAARPTAVNLTHSIYKVKQTLAQLPGAGASEATMALLALARALHAAEEARSRAMAITGARLLPSPCSVLTHCNTGRLAAPGLGTALGVVFEAAATGKAIEVFACETRPLWQGLRLTAWELGLAGIPVTVLCDGAAGALLASGRIHAVLVGADRIAANGDVANKIGTYALAVLARRHGVPFHVVAPRSTFDFSLAGGSGIPIEMREASEVLRPLGVELAPPDAGAWNPAFDVTPAELIGTIITEAGVLHPPLDKAIQALSNFPES